MYTPGFAPTASTADVPDTSPNRQYPTGRSPFTNGPYDPGGGEANVAPTVVAAFNVTTHDPVPLHPPPDQPPNDDPLPAAALNVTFVPLANDAAHAVPQLIPRART